MVYNLIKNGTNIWRHFINIEIQCYLIHIFWPIIGGGWRAQLYK